jgi:type VI protein secretion system component Hcp
MTVTISRRRLATYVAVAALLLIAATSGGSRSGSTRHVATPLAGIHLTALSPDAIFMSVAGFSAGESLAAVHPQTAEVDTVGSALSNSGAPTSSTVGKVSASTVTITKAVDSYTPQLQKAASTGTLLTTVTIYLDRLVSERETDVAVYTLSGVLVKSDSLRFGAANGTGTESVAFAVRQLKFSYRMQKPDGSLAPALSYCWNFATNKAC